MSAFEHVVDGGGPALVLVHGPSGIGKSALVREIEQPLSARGGHFGAGKFDQLERRRPYGAVAEALDELLTGRLTEREASMQRLREELLAQLGPNLALLMDLVPALAAVVGAAQPAPPELIGRDVQRIGVSAPGMPGDEHDGVESLLDELAQDLETERCDCVGAVLDRVFASLERLDRVGAREDDRKYKSAVTPGQGLALRLGDESVEPDRIVITVPLDRPPREVRDRIARHDLRDLVRAQPGVLAPRT